MVTIRTIATVCAALFAGLALTFGPAEFTPAAAQSVTEAQPGAPLNLLPRIAKTKKLSRHARTTTRVAETKTFAKRRTFAKAEPVAKPRSFKRTAQRRAAPSRTFARRAAPTRAFARRQNHSVIASTEDDAAPQSHSTLGFQAETQVARPTSPWLGAPLETTDPTPTSTYALASADGEAPAGETTNTAPANVPYDTVQVADAGEVNEIDLAAAESPPPANKSWLNAFLAVLGGAFAAAASARFLLG
jgi:hypothetical protein